MVPLRRVFQKQFQCMGAMGSITPSFCRPAWSQMHQAPQTILVRSFARQLKPVVRDPEKPVLPLSSWMRFLAAFRSEQAATPAKEVMQKASQKWKAMTAAEKRKFDEAAEADKRVYTEAMKVYVDSGKKDSWKRDPERPKRPATGFMRYVKDFRERNPNLKMIEQAKEAGVAWKKFSDVERAVYDSKYSEEKKAYEEAMRDYTASGKEEAWKKRVGIKDLEDKESKKKEQLKEKERKQKEKDAERKQKQQERIKVQKEKEAEKKRKQKEVDKNGKAKEADKKQKEKEEKKVSTPKASK